MGQALCKKKKKRFDVEKIYSAVEEALQTIEPDKGGIPGDLALKNFILGLAKIFEERTGKKASIEHDFCDNQYFSPRLSKEKSATIG